jgi:hypothetical protein
MCFGQGSRLRPSPSFMCRIILFPCGLGWPDPQGMLSLPDFAVADLGTLGLVRNAYVLDCGRGCR